MVKRATRKTRRKEHIAKLLSSTYAGQPVLLDELRWAVLGAEIDSGHYAGTTVTRSWMNSFARTIREQFSDHTIHKIPINGSTPVGLVAHLAVYRLHDLNKLRQFLAGDAPCISCEFVTDWTVEEPRYTMPYVTPQFHVATFQFFPREPADVTSDEVSFVRIPATQKISVVAPPSVKIHLPSLSAVPWRLIGYENCLAPLEPGVRS